MLCTRCVEEDWCSFSCQKLPKLIMLAVISYGTMELIVFSSELMRACIFNINSNYLIYKKKIYLQHLLNVLKFLYLG